MFINLLKKFKDSNCNVAVYSNLKEKSNFLYGQILDFNDIYFIMKLFSPTGTSDGLIIKETDQIFRIEQDSLYCNKMKNLIECNYTGNKEKYNFDREDLVHSFLSMIKEKNDIVSLELLNSGCTDAVGFIETIENGICQVKQIDEYGMEDGISYIALSDITEASFGSSEEIILYQLWKTNILQNSRNK